MKKTVIILLSIIAIITACDDNLLDVNPQDAITAEQLYGNEDFAQKAVDGIYHVYLNAFKDHLYVYGRWGSDGSGYKAREMSRGSEDPSMSFFKNEYQRLYSLVVAANDVIDGIDGNEAISEEKRRQWLGEARFARAIAYFYIRNRWGDAVLLTQKTDPQDTYLFRSPESEIKAVIIEDLNYAIDNLAVSYDNAQNGRFTKGAAVALKGKLHLYDEEFTEAYDELIELTMEPYNYSLVDDYGSMFTVDGENNTEIICQVKCIMQADLGSPLDVRFGFRSNNASGWSSCTPSWPLVTSYLRKDGTEVPWETYPQRDDYDDEVAFGDALVEWYTTEMTPELMDKRCHASCILPGYDFVGANNRTYRLYWPYEEHENDTPPALRTNKTSRAIYCWRKFVTPGTTNIERWDSPTDLPLIRYADVLLMLAECELEKADGNVDNAVSYLNQIRQRADVEPIMNDLSNDDLRLQVRLERLKELAGEGLFVFDQLRWRTAHTDDPIFGLNRPEIDFRGERMWDKVFKPHYYLYPIPQEERDINPNLTQNPDW